MAESTSGAKYAGETVSDAARLASAVWRAVPFGVDQGGLLPKASFPSDGGLCRLNGLARAVISRKRGNRGQRECIIVLKMNKI